MIQSPQGWTTSSDTTWCKERHELLGPMAHPTLQTTLQELTRWKQTQRTTTKGEEEKNTFINSSNIQHTCLAIRTFGLLLDTKYIPTQRSIVN